MSVRNLSPEVVALIKKDIVRPALFILADFPSGAQRFWTGYSEIEWPSGSGNFWQGVGGAISFNTMAETVDTAAKGLSAKLNGLNTVLTHKIINDKYQGRRAQVDLAFWDWTVSPFILVSPPEPLWRGQLDTDAMEVGATGTDLTVNSEHRLIDILRKRELRYNDHDQQLLYPGRGDTGLNKMPQIADIAVPWGRAQA